MKRENYNIKSILHITALVTIILISLLLITGCVNKDEENYNNTVSELNSAKDDLSNKITEGESLCSSTDSSSVSDPNTIVDLKNEVENAKTINANNTIPDDKPDNENYKDETEKLNLSLTNINDEITKLNSAIDKVKQSKDSKANELYQVKERQRTKEKDNNGYEIETIISTSDYLKGTNTDAINKAWKNAGGSGNAPTISNMKNNVQSGGIVGYNDANCAVIIGSIKHQCNTNGFPFNGREVDTSLFLDSCDSKQIFRYIYNIGTNPSSSGIGEFKDLLNTMKIRADMKNNTWGPVAFMIVLDNVFTPNTPNGCSDIDNFKWKFTGQGANQYFTLKRTW